MITHILAAVDSTVCADIVVDMATEIAEKFDARVHLFRIVHLMPEFPPAAATPVDTLNDYLLHQAREELSALAHGHPRVTVMEPALSGDQAWRLIDSTAIKIDADLIMIGSHHFGGWDRLFGTTSARVANHAGRHVFVVHQPPS